MLTPLKLEIPQSMTSAAPDFMVVISALCSLIHAFFFLSQQTQTSLQVSKSETIVMVDSIEGHLLFGPSQRRFRWTTVSHLLKQHFL